MFGLSQAVGPDLKLSSGTFLWAKKKANKKKRSGISCISILFSVVLVYFTVGEEDTGSVYICLLRMVKYKNNVLMV